MWCTNYGGWHSSLLYVLIYKSSSQPSYKLFLVLILNILYAFSLGHGHCSISNWISSPSGRFYCHEILLQATGILEMPNLQVPPMAFLHSQLLREHFCLPVLLQQLILFFINPVFFKNRASCVLPGAPTVRSKKRLCYPTRSMFETECLCLKIIKLLGFDLI